MPRPIVPQTDISPVHFRPHRRSDGSPLLHFRLQNTPPGHPRFLLHRLHRLCLDALVRERMRSEPELGRAVGEREVADGGVGDDEEGAFRVLEAGVFVYGLAQARS